mgnify:CR=1 FL=1
MKESNLNAEIGAYQMIQAAAQTMRNQSMFQREGFHANQ